MPTRDSQKKEVPKQVTEGGQRGGYQPKGGPLNPKPPQGGSVTGPAPPKEVTDKK